VIEVFFDEFDLGTLGFAGLRPAATRRPAYDPATLLKLYLYGYFNRVPSSRRLEREAQRNIEVMWLTGRPAPDHQTIAKFRRDAECHGKPLDRQDSRSIGSVQNASQDSPSHRTGC